MPGRRAAVDAFETRMAILRRAADVASVEGMEGLTIGRLAADLGMSKSGVIGHFGTKEQLQLATIDYAAGVFRRKVWEPVQHLRPGLERLLAACESWVRYTENPGFPGGCFFAAASFEWDGRPGPVRDAVAEVTDRWRRTLVADIRAAIADGDLPADLDPEQVAFAIKALVFGMNPTRQMHGVTEAAAWCLQAIHALLRLDHRSCPTARPRPTAGSPPAD